MDSNRNYLNPDNSLMEKNLKFVNNDFEENFKKYFGGSGANATDYTIPERDYQVIQPKPGYCIKTFKVNAQEKYFINVCLADEIPAPQNISETELTDILNSDEPSSFRIPMSISEPRITKDKSNNPVDAIDIAINPKFFLKIKQSVLFRDFFLALIGEAVNEKYNVQIKIDKAIILNNRKVIGNLVQHRVRNKDVKTVLNTYENQSEQNLKDASNTTNNSLIQELNEDELSSLRKAAEEMKRKALTINNPENVPSHKLRARLRENSVQEILAELFLPDCISAKEISLDIGKDRILVESTKHGYVFDKFLTYNLNPEKTRAVFNKTNKMLQIRVPVI